MRYARILREHWPRFAVVEWRDGEDWVTDMLPDFPEAESRLAEHYRTEDLFFEPFPLKEAQLLAPAVPSKIVCVGRNYREHAAELGNEVPKEPLLFLKPPSSIIGSGEPIVYPLLSSRIDYEGELGIVIGSKARRLGAEEDVRPYIRGYTIVNDVTARDLQKSDGQWTRGKGFDTFCPVGPFVTDEIDALTSSIALATTLNGEYRQEGHTRDLIFAVPTLLRYITAFMTLEPGDLIATGTPAGVGPMQPGDVVAVSVEGIGTLTNSVSRQAEA